MLSEDEVRFIKYWEAGREEYSGFRSKLLRGLPVAALFGLPILVLIITVYLFFPDWYTKISNATAQTFLVVVIAIIIFIVCFAYARMHFKWEMNEQLYLELKYKQKKSAATSQS